MNRSLCTFTICSILTGLVPGVSSPVQAQGGTTSAISGIVADRSGAVLPGATVSAKHLGTGVVTATVANPRGAFAIASLPIGTYEVSASHEGFKTAVIQSVNLTSAQPTDVRLTLEVGGVTELLTVASTSEIIHTQSTTISSTITTNQITRLPLTSRSAMDFVNFLPGVSTPGANRDATINGLPQGVINITLDGINIQDNTLRTSDGFFAILSPRLDAIEELSVTAAGQGADAGQGAVQIKFVTRSGGNSYSGSGYHYYRSDKLNANTWFNNRDSAIDPETGKATKAKLRQNQAGVRFGGPLVIPGVIPRGKAFFFGNYEELSQPSEVTRTRLLLSTRAQSGNYTYGGATVNVLALAAGSAATAATSSPDPTIGALLHDIRAAAAGVGGGLNSRDANLDELRYGVPVESKRRFPTARVDYSITDNHRLTSAFNYNWFRDSPDTSNDFEPQWPGFPAFGGQASIRYAWSNSVRSTLGQNLVNEARVGYGSSPFNFFSEMNVGMYEATLANQKGFHLNFPSIGSQLTAASPAPSPQDRNATDLAIEDSVAWLRGNHHFTGGVSWTSFDLVAHNSTLLPRVSFGLLANDPATTVITEASLQAATGVQPSSTQLTQARDLYAFLTGRVSSIGADARLNDATGEYMYTGVGTQRSQMRETGFFLQDSWRWKPNLTINMGLRYSLQFPFTASNNSYTTPTVEDVCGRSGVNSNGNGCNLFQPGVMPGKANPQFFRLEKGKSAYNTDYNNLAPNVGVAWTPAPRGGFLGALMSEEFVLRAGWARAFSRNGMNDFTGQYNSNPGVVVSANRNAGLLNIIPPGGSAPVLFRNDANLFPGAFPTTPVYPMTDVPTGDIRMFAPDIEIPYADSWSTGVQRKVTTNMAAEIRYVGTLSRDLWQARNFNEVNIVENGFLEEFRAAQRNLQANIAAGPGAGCVGGVTTTGCQNTFAFTGAPGTAPLPILLAHLNAQPFANAGNPALYSGGDWRATAFLALLAQRNPNPYGFANTSTMGTASTTALIGNATYRGNAFTAGVPRNFFIANPDLVGGAFLTRNEGFTDYHSMQLELRHRLVHGFQFQTSYVFGKAMQSGFLSHRVPPQSFRDVGSPGDIAHQFKANVVYDLPFGQGRRFMGGAGAFMERLVGGWQVGINTRIQSGRLVDIGNVRLVGWTRDEVEKSFKLRFDHEGRVIFNFPEDVVTNTIRAFSVSSTTASGYSGAEPVGRYFTPANGPDCFEVVVGSGDCGGTRELILQGPVFRQSDLRVAKRTRIVGRVNLEFAAEALNVFNKANFVPNGQSSSTTLNNWRVTSLTGTNTARVIQLVSRINW